MERLKSILKSFTFLYDVYLFFFNRPFYFHRKREIKFYGKLIPQNSVIFDVGANVGSKTDIFHRLGGYVIALEPDPTNHLLLNKKFRNKKKIKILPYAVSDSLGTASFYQITPGSAYNTLNVKWKELLGDSNKNRWHTSQECENIIEVKTTTLDSLISEFGKPKYIKIDVEGNELSCIKGLSQKIDLISFEANLPEFKNETLQIIAHLKNIESHVQFNYMRDDERFEMQSNQSIEEFHNFLCTTELRYMEIFSFMNSST